VPVWLILAVLALVVWGFWGLFFNLTSRHLTSFNAIVWEVAGAAIVAVLVLIGVLRWSNLQTEGRGVVYGLATGVSYTAGLLLAFAALRFGITSENATSATGRIATVLVLTALYPLLAIVLNAVLLSEPVSIRQIIALTLGLAAVIIITTG
jgi:drug/metabolite transporter (DMT)-like permease